MNILTVEDIKRNSRIDESYEDEFIEAIAEATEEAFPNILRRTWEDVYETYGKVPAPVKHAMLMYADHLFKERGMASQTAFVWKPSPAFLSLLKPYIKLAK